jgi:RimJ/RimL family protein N-acetyltransferase
VPPSPTEHLVFRRWRDEDLPLAKSLFGDPRVTALVGGPFDDDQVRARLAFEIGNDAVHGYQYWPMFAGDDFVGCCGLKPYDDVVELGFYLMTEQQGRGYAVEAARAAIAHAFDAVGAPAIYACHHPQNIASRRTIEKLGFTYSHDALYPPTGLQHPNHVLRRHA